MQLDTIGKNIRKYRLMKKFRQEDLAEKAGLTTIISVWSSVERKFHHLKPLLRY